MVGIILLVILIALLVGGLPSFGLQPYGYYPSSGLGLVALVIIVLLLMGRI